jgi:hypothetical protein
MVGNSNPLSSTSLRGPPKDSAVATAAAAVVALGITATSSTSAPMVAANSARRRSSSLIHWSHGEPPVSHDRVNVPSAASTSVDKAPWEQLFT